MITRMKKLTLLIYHKEYEAFLTQMQQLGVLHVQAAQDGSPSSPGLEEKPFRHKRRNARTTPRRRGNRRPP